MDRAEAIYRAADAVYRYWPDDDAIKAAVLEGLDGDDRGAAELFGAALLFIRDELGEEPVRNLRAKYERESAWARRRQTVRKVWRDMTDTSGIWP